ncbi:MAG: hypothetical protein JWO59_3415, partial [Chloroflexi bacterium]|nr:hypothetical protein [Chloroflexota bacterium]
MGLLSPFPGRRAGAPGVMRTARRRTEPIGLLAT